MIARHTFTPGPWSRVEGKDYILTKVSVTAPTEGLPKSLPKPPDRHAEIWFVLVDFQKWMACWRVLQEDPDDKFIVEGHVAFFEHRLYLLAQSIKSLRVERERREAQRAASMAAVAS